MLEELRISLFSSADENQDAYFANSTTKVMGSFGNQLK